MDLELSEDLCGSVMHFILTQFSLNQGLKKFGKKGEASMSKKLLQLHMLDTLVPLDYHKLIKDEWAKAISSLMFLKEKCDVSIKGWACAYGRLA